MRKKSIVMALILTIAIAGVGTGFSVAFETIKISNSVVIPPEGVNISLKSWTDNETGIDVGYVEVTQVNTQHLLVTIINGYPGYGAYIDFNITNTGLNPILLYELANETQITEAFYVNIDGINPGTFLATGETIVGLLTIEVLDGATMGSTYLTKTIEIKFQGTLQP